MKQCTRCKQTKPLEAFKRRGNGQTSRCRVCLHQIDKAREKQHRHVRRAIRQSMCPYCKVLMPNTKLQLCGECLPYKGVGTRSVLTKWLVRLAETKDRELLEGLRKFLTKNGTQTRYGSQASLKAPALQILELFEAQNFVCAICRGTIAKPFVDHSHETMKVRAILCMQCNTAVGMVRENYSIAVQLAQFIKKHTC